MTQPIKPSDVAAQRRTIIPEGVIKVFNHLIAENYAGGESMVKQEAVIECLVRGGFNRSQIFDKGWLNVEELFRASGWEVEYHKSDYTDTYDSYFVFRGA
jgi:hypothetical protein